MSHGKQFTFYTHWGGPNGWKVVFVLEELGLTYESVYLSFDDNEQKAPEYSQYNPNGRIPAIIDHHNGDFVVWESCAIMLYLVERYDKEHTIWVEDPKERISMIQWLFFQASGQGAYFGQAWHFLAVHPVKHATAIDRYMNEMKRVLGVLDNVLAEHEWLVGGKCTIADLSFIPWNDLALSLMIPHTEINLAKDFPAVNRWHQNMLTRGPVRRALAIKASVSHN